jgi:hypothetical protein
MPPLSYIIVCMISLFCHAFTFSGINLSLAFQTFQSVMIKPIILQNLFTLILFKILCKMLNNWETCYILAFVWWLVPSFC